LATTGAGIGAGSPANSQLFSQEDGGEVLSKKEPKCPR